MSKLGNAITLFGSSNKTFLEADLLFVINNSDSAKENYTFLTFMEVKDHYVHPNKAFEKSRTDTTWQNTSAYKVTCYRCMKNFNENFHPELSCSL